MQSLTNPASVTKRKQACNSCRHRKKRCDGGRPLCSLCRKWGINCEYTVPASNSQLATEGPLVQFPGVLYPAQPTFPVDFDQNWLNQNVAFDFLQYPGMNFDLISGFLDGDAQAVEFPSPASSKNNSSKSTLTLGTEEGTGTSLDQELTTQNGLPANHILLELLGLFFDNVYPQFPCFHQDTLRKEVQDETLQREASSFLYAICAIACSYHRNPSVKRNQREWYETAKFAYDLSLRNPDPALRTIQTAILIICHGLTVGDFSTSWLTVGKAWRQASVLGLNRMDAPRQGNVYGISHTIPEAAVVREEYRRTLWMLFIMDRNHAWPTGWPNAIDERQFKVDIPVADEVFQAMTVASTSDTKPTPFTRNLNTLISELLPSTQPPNILHYICVAHTLLGRISEQIHSLYSAPDSLDYAEECEELDTVLVKFRLSLPRHATSVLDAPPESRTQVIWLNVITNAMAILLHFRCAALPNEPAAQDQFARAVLAAKNTAKLIKDASRISTELLINIHIGGALYIAACVLIIQWRMTGDDCLHPDIDILILVFKRIEERFTFLGLKFGLALERDLERDMESVRELREAGLRGLLADCSKWSFVKEKAAERGIFIT